MLKTSTGRQVLPVHSQGKEFEVKYEPNMEVFQCCTTVCYRDSEISLIAFANAKLDFCMAVLWDNQTNRIYLLFDKLG